MCMKWLLLKLKKNLYSLAPWNKSYEKPRKCIKKKKKSRGITLPTKVSMVKAMAFPVVIYRCESWTIKQI